MLILKISRISPSPFTVASCLLPLASSGPSNLNYEQLIHDFGTGDKIDLGAVLDNIGYLGSSSISDQYVRYFLTPFVETKHDKSLQIWTEANQSDQHNLSGYNDVISS